MSQGRGSALLRVPRRVRDGELGCFIHLIGANERTHRLLLLQLPSPHDSSGALFLPAASTSMQPCQPKYNECNGCSAIYVDVAPSSITSRAMGIPFRTTVAFGLQNHDPAFTHLNEIQLAQDVLFLSTGSSTAGAESGNMCWAVIHEQSSTWIGPAKIGHQLCKGGQR